VVLDELETPRIRYLRRGALTGEDTIEHLTRHRVVEAPTRHETIELGDVRRREAQPSGIRDDVLAGRVRAARRLAEPPLLGGCGACPGRDRLLDELDCAGVDDVAHLEVAEAPLGLEALATS